MYSRATGNNRQIKIVITGGLGDCLLATPFVRYFARCGEYDKIICAVTQDSGGMFELNPQIDQLITCSGPELMLWAVPERDCDIFSPYIEVAPPEHIEENMQLNVSHILSPNQVPVPILRQVAEWHGIRLDDDAMEIPTSREDEAWARRCISQFNGKPVIFFNAESQLPEKDLSKRQSQKIVDLLNKDFVVLQLGRTRNRIDGTVLLESMPTVRQSAALFRYLFGVVTVDSFPGHLAKAVGTPAVVLFGPTNPETFGHAGNRNIRADICSPCADTPRKNLCENASCMEGISAVEVAAALASIGRDFSLSNMPQGS